MSKTNCPFSLLQNVGFLSAAPLKGNMSYVTFKGHVNVFLVILDYQGRNDLKVKEDGFHLMDVHFGSSVWSLVYCLSVSSLLWRSENCALLYQVLLVLLNWHCQRIELWCSTVYTHPIPGVKFSGWYWELSLCQGMWRVIWFLFHVLQLLLIRCTQRHLCWVSKSMMKHQQKSDSKLDLPWFNSG